MPDQAFGKLFAETEETTWESVERVSRRARRRSARQATVVAGIVAVGLVSGGVTVAQVNGAPSPIPAPADSAPVSPAPTSAPASAPASTPSSTPSSTSPVNPPSSQSTSRPPAAGITNAMMLQPADVGRGYVAVAASGGDWSFEFNASVTGCPQGSKPDPVDERSRTLRKGRSQDETFVVQHTARYAGDRAEVYLAGVRERVASCEAPAGQSVRIAARNFAGDESLLVVFHYGDDYLTQIVLVRKGDVLTEIFSKPNPEEAVSRSLGRKAAARL